MLFQEEMLLSCLQVYDILTILRNKSQKNTKKCSVYFLHSKKILYFTYILDVTVSYESSYVHNEV